MMKDSWSTVSVNWLLKSAVVVTTLLTLLSPRELLTLLSSETSAVVLNKISQVAQIAENSTENPDRHETEIGVTATASEPSISIVEFETNETSPLMPDREPTVDSEPQVIFFAHIGKTGGVSVRSQTEVGCRAFKNKIRFARCTANLMPSAVSDQVKGYFHVGYLTGTPAKDATGFLYPVRDPLDRIVSWYMQMHPSNLQYSDHTRLQKRKPYAFNSSIVQPHEKEFFLDCFWDLNSFAEALMGPSASKCTKVARKAHNSRKLGHIYFGYEFYTRGTIKKFPEKDVYAIRTDHLWDDFNSLNFLLGGGNSTNITGRTEDHGSSDPDIPITNRTITPTGVLGMCCALRDEIEVYKTILQRAKNLDHPDINQHRCHEVLRSSEDKCPQMTDASLSIFLVHIGRTGGATVRSRAEIGCSHLKNKNRRKQCRAKLSPSAVSDNVNGYLHVGDRTGVPAAEATGYLFTVRDPLDRFISSYLQLHPANTQFKANTTAGFEVSKVKTPLSEFFMDCFWDLNSYGEVLMGSRDDPFCSGVARSAPKSRKMGHLFWDYRWYAGKTMRLYPDKDIYAIRAEHMWEDFDSLNTLLGGQGLASTVSEQVHDNPSNPGVPMSNRTLSPAGLLGLCCSLRQEIEVYEGILRRAKNLKDPDLKAHRCYRVLLEAGVGKCPQP